MSRRRSVDDETLGRLLAPPALDDGVESLDYWGARSQRLPWYRIRARREAVRMTVRWEQRVGAAIVSQRRMPLETRISAGVLVGRTRLARWSRRAGVAVVATLVSVIALVAIPTTVALIYMLHLL